MTDEPKREFFNRVEPKLTAFAVSLQEEDSLTTDQVADSLMSAAVAIAVGCQGRERTAVLLGAIAAAVMAGRYDGAAEISTSPLN